ncbi:MAG: MerR family transcriptional regulator [Gammaproteobacteria bacterium]
MQKFFSSRQASRLVQVTPRQLTYWRKTGLVAPSHQTPGGHARYSFTDLISLKTAKRLIDAGVSVQQIRKSLSSLTSLLPSLNRPLTELSLIATGDIILVFHEGSTFEAISGQEWIFPLAQLQDDIEKMHPETSSIQEELFPMLDIAGGSFS